MKTKIIVGSFLLVAFFGLFAFSVQAIEYGQMGGKPTNFDPEIPDSKSWFIYNLDPGTTKEDSMTVANLFEDSWVAVIYAADSIKSSSGGFALRQLTEPKEAVGSWVKFYPDPKPEFASKVFEEKKTIDEVCKVSSDDLRNNFELDESKIPELEEWCRGKELVELELKSGEKKDLLFVITIPKDSDVGEHTGGILIQKKAKDETAQSDGSKVMLTTRVGVRIYETVPGEIIKKLTFSDFTVSKNFDEFYLPWNEDKKAKFKEFLINSSVKNSGNISTNFSEKIIIHNVITRKTEILEGREFQVLRGDDFISSLAWKSPRLAYLNFQKEYTYQNTNGDEQIIQSDSINKWFIPWREMVIFIFCAVVVGAIYYAWRRYQKKYYGGIGWADYAVRENETIQTLSSKFNVAWKTLVKTNKLKAPYMLEVGQVIKVPNTGGEVEEELTVGLESDEFDLSAPENVDDELSLPEKDNQIIDLKNIKNKKEKLPEIKEEPGLEVTYPVTTPEFTEDSLDEEKTDTVDSSLFFGEEEFDKQVPQKEENIKSEIVAEEKKIKKINSKPLAKKELKQKGVVVEEKVDLNIEEISGDSEELFIKGVKEDSKKSVNWLIYILLLAIIILLGAVAFLLLQNKSNSKMIISNPAPVANEVKTEPQASPAEEMKKDEVKEEIAPVAEEIDGTKLEVKVFNGSGVAGAAGKIKDFLVSKKYENVQTGNYSSEEVMGSVIYYKEENLKGEAEWLADILKDKEIEAEVKIASSEEEKSADLVIVLGK